MIFNETIGAVSGDGNTLVPYLNNFIPFNFDHFKHTDYKYRLSYKSSLKIYMMVMLGQYIYFYSYKR